MTIYIWSMLGLAAGFYVAGVCEFKDYLWFIH